MFKHKLAANSTRDHHPYAHWDLPLGRLLCELLRSILVRILII